MSSPAKYASASEAKSAGWFSRRHQTSQPHFDSRMKREEKLRNQVMDREIRGEQWKELTAKEKISTLDRRLGEGQGAKKQRAKILASEKKTEEKPEEKQA